MRVVTALLIVMAVAGSAAGAQSAVPAAAASSPDRAVVDRYCVTCHNQKLKTGGLALDTVDLTKVAENGETLEKVVRKLRGGLMPPAGRPRPDRATYNTLATSLETALDRAAIASPNPGRTEAFHRLNRAEYRNTIRDLLALDVDVTDLLPGDDASYGFDNMAGALKINQSLMERYLSAAHKISRLAVGTPPATPTAETFRVPAELPQHEQIEGLPVGTRGGQLIHFTFPVDGEYEFKVEFMGGAPTQPEQLEISVDGEVVKLFPVTASTPRSNDRLAGTVGLIFRSPVKAGPHDVAVTFLRSSAAYFEGARRRFVKPRVYDLGGTMAITQPIVGSVVINGPFDVSGPGDTPSRRRIFVCRPATAADEPACARRILTTLARRAYRRPATEIDIKPLLAFYKEGHAEGRFEDGIELALRRLLVTPEFIFRIESDPAAAGTRNYRIGDFELASRLSFFLWSSIPDDQLLDMAVQGKLRSPSVLDREVRRMIADPRATALVSNFLGQWLYLRNVPNVTPADDLFPDFDGTLRQAFQRETELFFASIMRDDRSVVELLTADYTFVNERLARHYGIPNVTGTDFRRVTLTDDNRRGLLGQGSIHTVNSRPNRTSPVLRGKWVLQNILGTPPPPPPPNVPPLREEQQSGTVQTMRERMAQHRANPVCASCHSMIDPIGFAFEHFDAVGAWRDLDEAFRPIDASGALPDGTKFEGVAGLRQALVATPDRFVTAMTEKLLTYALGRGLEYYDAPTVRRIVREAGRSDYRFSSLVLGIVTSTPFQMRRADDAPAPLTVSHRAGQQAAPGFAAATRRVEQP